MRVNQVLKSSWYKEQIARLRIEHSLKFIVPNLFVGVIWNGTDWIFINSPQRAIMHHWCPGNPQGTVCENNYF